MGVATASYSFLTSYGTNWSLKDGKLGTYLKLTCLTSPALR